MKLENLKKVQDLAKRLEYLQSRARLFAQVGAENDKDWPSWVEVRIQGAGETRAIYSGTASAIAALIHGDVLRELAELENEISTL